MTRRFAWLVAVVCVASCKDAEGKPPVAPVPSVPPKPKPPSPPPADPDDVTAQDYPMPPLPHARVTVTDAFGGKHPVDAEVAHTSPQRTRGLMWRSSLLDGKGMIFLFPQEQRLSFWMKNTLIPLDLIFIDGRKNIVGCVENAEPRTLSSRSAGGKSQYVLEVPAGWCAKTGLKPGLPITIEGVEGLLVTPD